MKQYMLLLVFVGGLLLSSKGQPPNNLIFFGGAGEGSHQSAFSLAPNGIFSGSIGDGFGLASNNSQSNAIFLGGTGDGISAVSNSTTENNIFAGSTGDGFSNQSNNVVANNIFLGSEGDGFAQQSNNALSNVIFLGSGGDGFSHNTNASLPNNIFTGGEGDGWHAVILPLGPLPVKLLSFTAEYSGSAHLVKWITTEEINTDHFEVQRSANGRDFISLGNVAPAGGPAIGAAYNKLVAQPWTGNNFYRLKIVDTDGSVAFSNIVLLKNMDGLQVAVFPNPAADVLYVRIPPVNNTVVITAKLYDANGKLLMQPVLKAGSNNPVSVEQLAAGVYSLHCIIDQKPFVFRFMKLQ